MIKRILSILFFLLNLSAGAQNWAPVSGDPFHFQLERVLYDSVHNELLVSSKFMKDVGTFPARGIVSWDGTSWDSLSSGINTHDTLNVYPGGMALCCIPYGSKLLVGGMFGSVGGINATSLALWDGISWDSLPVRAFKFSETPPQVAGFYQYGSLLYIYGTFDSIAGQPASGLATWDGTNFQGITIPEISNIGIKGVIEYKNELYVGGQFYSVGSTDTVSHIIKFNGSNWVSVGSGLLGWNAGISSMLIYQNELYVAGHFLIADGNVGENIMKWDGTQWYDVGFGGEAIGLVWQMMVFNDKIWAVGNFLTAAYMPATSIACYDGERWCIPKDSLNNGIISIAAYNDTLYIAGGFNYVYGDSALSYCAKIEDTDLYRECNPAIPINTNSTTISLYPNPFTSQITLSSDIVYQGVRVTICNSLGQNVYSTLVDLGSSTTIFPGNLAKGFYYLKIQDNKQTIFSQKLIKAID